MRCRTAAALLVAVLCALAAATTLPEYIDRCEVDLWSDKSTECGTDAMFCTGYAFLGRDANGEPERRTGCRPCEVMPAGMQRDAAVADPLNVCNCAGGQFCRHTGPATQLDNRVIGYCEPSTLIGTPCNSTDQCIGVREPSTDGGAARREVGFCVGGRCAQCDPATYATTMGADVHVCPGYTQLSNGQRVYHNSMPGVSVSCSADGVLVTSGTPNFELKSGDAPPPPKTSGGNKDTEPYVLGLLVPIFLGTLCIAALLCALVTLIVGLLFYRRRRNGTLLRVGDSE